MLKAMATPAFGDVRAPNSRRNGVLQVRCWGTRKQNGFGVVLIGPQSKLKRVASGPCRRPGGDAPVLSETRVQVQDRTTILFVDVPFFVGGLGGAHAWRTTPAMRHSTPSHCLSFGDTVASNSTRPIQLAVCRTHTPMACCMLHLREADKLRLRL